MARKKKRKVSSFSLKVLKTGFLFLIVLICVYLLVNYVFRRTVVHNVSMQDTLYDGDNIIMDELSYNISDPKRFDVICFKSYKEKELLIKRVIGLPGETIQIKDGVIFINDKEIKDRSGHRGSVDEDKAWHKILSYFSSATQIGMTATPKETKALSNIEYFGEPIYTYSLKQGIDDGFLAPYKVLRVGMNVDLEGYRPEHGKTDISGELIEDRLYNTKDFDRNIVIDERTDLVAKKIMEYLTNSDPMAKTIVFCVDIEHAERMRLNLK